MIHVPEQGRALGVFVVCGYGVGSAEGGVISCFSMPGSWPPHCLRVSWGKLIGEVVGWFNGLGVWKHGFFGDRCPLGCVF